MWVITCVHASTHTGLIHRVQQLVYVVYVHMPTFIEVCIILDMRMLTHTLFFPYYFLKFSKYFWLLYFRTV